MSDLNRPARLFVLAALGLALAGCVTNDKGVSGVFDPTPIESPPSVRGTSGEAKPAQTKGAAKPTAKARPRALTVPQQAQ